MSPGDVFPSLPTAESVRQLVSDLEDETRPSVIADAEITFQVVRGQAVQISDFHGPLFGRVLFDPVAISPVLQAQGIRSKRPVSNGTKNTERYLLFR